MWGGTLLYFRCWIEWSLDGYLLQNFAFNQHMLYNFSVHIKWYILKKPQSYEIEIKSEGRIREKDAKPQFGIVRRLKREVIFLCPA